MTKQKQIRINYDMDTVKENISKMPMFQQSYEKTLEAFELEASVIPPSEDDEVDLSFKAIFNINSYEEYFNDYLWDALLERVGVKNLVLMSFMYEEDEVYTKQLAEASAVIYNKLIPLYQKFMQELDLKDIPDNETSEDATVLEGELLVKGEVQQETFKA